MDTLGQLLEKRIEAEFGWVRRTEITVRALACLAVFLAGLALAIGAWQPTPERALQWTLALTFLWTSAHLLRSIVGGLASLNEAKSERLRG
ncbi:hypothetical protein [Bradyrhizobium sp. NP1]|uniref:hypothetical protein n=1 Tax=Bradyrhizobium sp. NP1 TaxID=3049772 RepID=UPI0025A53F47|nr:hypothetical protein [Bradyrhizobium sp. NP1]WJR78776.1 hypothetical protein QOU61_02905 [Bradyrhizobium sp. NP1]